jgi:hypothetical protein
MLSTVYTVMTASKSMPMFIQGIDFALGLLVLVWGQLSALFIVLVSLRERMSLRLNLFGLRQRPN